MNILMISHTPLFPPRSGVVRRNLHMFLEAAREHAVTLLILGSGHDDEGFRRHYGDRFRAVVTVDIRNVGWRRVLRVCLYILTGWGWVRHWHKRKVQKTIDALCTDAKPDIVHLTNPLLRMYRYPSSASVVADAHNVEYDNLERVSKESTGIVRRMFFRAFAWRLKQEESASCRRCDVVLAVSDRDRAMFRTMAPSTRIALVPNGVDLEEFAARHSGRKQHALLFVGMLDYQPNDSGIQFFLKNVFPRVQDKVPDAHLTIVGGNPSPAVRNAASPSVRVTGFVDDVRPYLQEAAVLVVPIYAGGGTRLKLLEAMAAGIPAVSTTIGCEGLDVCHNKHLLVADEPGAFADAVVRLLEDPALRNTLAGQALAAVRAEHGWDRIGDTLLAVYSSLPGTQARRLQTMTSVLAS